MPSLSPQIESCVRHLTRCHRMCLGTAMTQCVEMGGAHAEPQHLRLMLDCAAICQAAADALLRKSRFHERLCAIAADVADSCATDCEALGGMEDCVIACRTCADACRPAPAGGQADQARV